MKSGDLWAVAGVLGIVGCGDADETSGGAEPPTPTIRLVLELERDDEQERYPLARRALAGLPLLWDSEPVGELGRVGLTDFGAEFLATPHVGAPSTFAVRVPTPCGPRDLPIATWDLPQSRAGDLSFSDRHEITFASLALRRVYVAGGEPSVTVQVGEVELPGGPGAHAVFSHECSEASVSVGSEVIGTWRSTGPTFVDLDPATCHRYVVRTYSTTGFDHRGDTSRVLRGRAAETLPSSGEPYAGIDHYMEPLPSSVSRRVTEARSQELSSIVPVACPPDTQNAGEAAEAEAAPTSSTRSEPRRASRRPRARPGRAPRAPSPEPSEFPQGF